ncbi:SRPBCC domain-containing protein [Aeromicrobium sp. UC242_57]|uniref:SRPBCC domain-containing protein n=1 Tax=Aeromicrobium sp. UC242_57 TaxID=3374624 RepID=UPI00379F0032
MGRTDRASLLIHADHTTVFAALTDPDALLAWLPPQGMHGRFEQFDLRPGGSYRLALTYEDAAGSPGKTSVDTDVMDVRITQVVQDECLVQEVVFAADDPAFQGVMQMEWNVRCVDDGTEVELVAKNVPRGIRAHEHAEGMTSSLANLAAFLAR